LLDRAEIGLAVGLGRCTDRDEDDQRASDGGGEVRGEGEAGVRDVPADHLLEPRLVDGHLAGLEGGHLFGLVVDTENVVTEVGEDGACHKTHIARPHHADIHAGNSSYQDG